MISTGTYKEMAELSSSQIESNDPNAAHGRYMYYYRYMYRHGHIVTLEMKKQKKCITGKRDWKVMRRMEMIKGRERRRIVIKGKKGDRGKEKKIRKENIYMYMYMYCYDL